MGRMPGEISGAAFIALILCTIAGVFVFSAVGKSPGDGVITAAGLFMGVPTGLILGYVVAAVIDIARQK